MKLRTAPTLVLLAACLAGSLATAQKLPSGMPHPRTEIVRMPGPDGVTVVADLYLRHAEPATPFLVLFHDGSLNRTEYHRAAMRLMDEGYNCLAADLRAGQPAFGRKNHTHLYAKKAFQPLSTAAAELDLLTALRYVREHYAKGPMIALGCSYSASLVLRVAGTQPGLLDGAIAFSPAEHFGGQGFSDTFVQTSAAPATCPILILSKAVERDEWKPIFDALASEHKHTFAPEEGGVHGAEALWPRNPESALYWGALLGFLGEYFPTPNERVAPAEGDGERERSGGDGGTEDAEEHDGAHATDDR